MTIPRDTGMIPLENRKNERQRKVGWFRLSMKRSIMGVWEDGSVGKMLAGWLCTRI